MVGPVDNRPSILIFIDLFYPNRALCVKTYHTICLGYITHDHCFSLDNQLAITSNKYDMEFHSFASDMLQLILDVMGLFSFSLGT